jgi:molecular chaperone GrpE (heat shock protein)
MNTEDGQEIAPNAQTMSNIPDEKDVSVEETSQATQCLPSDLEDELQKSSESSRTEGEEVEQNLLVDGNTENSDEQISKNAEVGETETVSVVSEVTNSTEERSNASLGKPNMEKNATIPTNSQLQQQIQEQLTKIQALQAENRTLSERVQNLEKELDRLKEVPSEQTNHEQFEQSLIEQPPIQQPDQHLDSDQVSVDIWKQAHKDWEKDCQDFDRYQKQIENLSKIEACLRDGIAQIAESCKVSEYDRQLKKLPHEVQERLRKRHEGIQLIGRMVDRLQEKLPNLPSEDSISTFNQALGEIPEAGQATEQALKKHSNENYLLIVAARNLAEKRRKTLLHLVLEILKILDDLELAAQNTKTILEEIKLQYSESHSHLEHLDKWFSFYSTLQHEISQVLSTNQITSMSVKRGDRADYSRHEPTHGEPDSELKTEFVKEVIRQGYTYCWNDELQILRPAQVTIVKN